MSPVLFVDGRAAGFLIVNAGFVTLATVALAASEAALVYRTASLFPVSDDLNQAGWWRGGRTVAALS